MCTFMLVSYIRMRGRVRGTRCGCACACGHENENGGYEMGFALRGHQEKAVDMIRDSIRHGNKSVGALPFDWSFKKC